MITTKSSAKYTPVALESFFETTPFSVEDKFLLIDNDGGYSLPPVFADRVALERNPAPRGFAENMNRGIELALAHGWDLVLLNNDLVLTEGWFQALLRDRNAISSPLSNREVRYNTPSFNTDTVMTLEEYQKNPKGLKDLVTAHRHAAEGLMRVIVLPFFCVRLPHQVLKTLGLLDVEFGKGGGEDYDYCLRAWLAGFSVKFALQSYVLHFGGKSSYAGAETKEQQDSREFGFRVHFGYKWGESLLRLCLFEDREIIVAGDDLDQLIQSGQHSEAIRRLIGNRHIPLHLGSRNPSF